MYDTRIDLVPRIREASIAALQAQLSSSVDLFTQVAQAHRNLKGSTFIALRELFDSVAEIIEEQSDLIAERITALGGRAGAVRIGTDVLLNQSAASRSAAVAAHEESP